MRQRTWVVSTNSYFDLIAKREIRHRMLSGENWWRASLTRIYVMKLLNTVHIVCSHADLTGDVRVSTNHQRQTSVYFHIRADHSLVETILICLSLSSSRLVVQKVKPFDSKFFLPGTLKMRDMNLRDMKMRHHVAGVENGRHEFAAPTCKGGNCET